MALTAALVLTVAGTGVKVFSELDQARQQKELAEVNAVIAEQNAAAERRKTAFDVAQLTKEKRRLLSTQTALFGKAGVVTTTGTPFRVSVQTALEEELNIAARRFSGRVQAGRFESEARLSRARGRQFQRAGLLRAISTGIGGATKIGTSLLAPEE